MTVVSLKSSPRPVPLACAHCGAVHEPVLILVDPARALLGGGRTSGIAGALGICAIDETILVLVRTAGALLRRGEGDVVVVAAAGGEGHATESEEEGKTETSSHGRILRVARDGDRAALGS